MPKVRESQSEWLSFSNVTLSTDSENFFQRTLYTVPDGENISLTRLLAPLQLTMKSADPVHTFNMRVGVYFRRKADQAVQPLSRYAIKRLVLFEKGLLLVPDEGMGRGFVQRNTKGYLKINRKNKLLLNIQRGLSKRRKRSKSIDMLPGDSLVLYFSIIVNVESPMQDVLHEALIQEYISLAVQHSKLNWAAIKESRRAAENPEAVDHPAMRMTDVRRPRDAPALEKRIAVRPLPELLQQNSDRIRSMRGSPSPGSPSLSFSIAISLFRTFYIGSYRSISTDEYQDEGQQAED